MILAFALYKYFPFGGLQRDFLRIALECQTRGYKIRVYCMAWQGDVPAGFDVQLLPKKGLTSQAIYRNFSSALNTQLKENPATALIGFNKMPNLDVYYAADGCYEQRIVELYHGWKAWLYRAAGRYRHFSDYERQVFCPQSKTQILMISHLQQDVFQRIYQTPSERLHMLPPGISRDRCAPNNADAIRAEFRREFNLSADDLLLLMVGSGFKTKGVDRSVQAVINLPETVRKHVKLFVIGQDKTERYTQQAQAAGIGDKVVFLAGRDDVPRFLLGADLLIHPARNENTGTVLLEALVAGLPVLCSAVCGYATYIEQATAGRVLSSMSFDQAEFDKILVELLNDAPLRKAMRVNALEYSQQADLYSMPTKAADIIEASAKALGDHS